MFERERGVSVRSCMICSNFKLWLRLSFGNFKLGSNSVSSFLCQIRSEHCCNFLNLILYRLHPPYRKWLSIHFISFPFDWLKDNGKNPSDSVASLFFYEDTVHILNEGKFLNHFRLGSTTFLFCSIGTLMFTITSVKFHSKWRELGKTLTPQLQTFLRAVNGEYRYHSGLLSCATRLNFKQLCHVSLYSKESP